MQRSVRFQSAGVSSGSTFRGGSRGSHPPPLQKAPGGPPPGHSGPLAPGRARRTLLQPRARSAGSGACGDSTRLVARWSFHSPAPRKPERTARNTFHGRWVPRAGRHRARGRRLGEGHVVPTPLPCGREPVTSPAGQPSRAWSGRGGERRSACRGRARTPGNRLLTRVTQCVCRRLRGHGSLQSSVVLELPARAGHHASKARPGSLTEF